MANTNNKIAPKAKQPAGATPTPPKPAAPVVKPAKPSIFTRMAKFLKETWVELKKTSWPKQDELKKGTLLVLAAVVAVAIWIGGIDAFLGWITLKLGLV